MQKDKDRTPQPNTYPVFSKDFILSPNIVIDHSNKSKKQMEDFISAFSKRIQTELTYQKNLNQCSKLLEKYIEPTSEKCLSYISSAFKVDTEQRGKQAKDLAQSLRSEVIQPLTESLKKYEKLIRTSEKNCKKLNKDFLTLTDNFNKAKVNLQENTIQTEQMYITKNICRYTFEYPQQKKIKQINKIMETIAEKMEYQKNYQSTARQLNQIIETYQKQIAQMLNNLEQIQRQQIKLQSDAIRKLIVCQVSMFKNIQYDLINISKQMQKMYPETDIQIFKNQTLKLIIQQNKQKQYQMDMTPRIVDIEKSLLTLSLKNVQQQYYAWEFGLKRNKQLRRIISLRKKQLNPGIGNKNSGEEGKKINNSGENPDKDKEKQKQKDESKIQNNSQPPPQNQIQTLWKSLPKQLFKPPPNHKGICEKILSEEDYPDFLSLSQIINNIWLKDDTFSQENKQKFIKFIEKNQLLRILALLFIQQYRVESQIVLNWQNYLKIGQLAKTLIQICQKLGDVFTLKGLLALFFTFCSMQQDKQKKLLYQLPAISQCEIWKRSDYWLASIFESTYEQMASLSAQKGQTSLQTLLREKNSIFSQFAIYCHYMIMLGIPSKNVRKNVGKFCRLYDMTEQQNRTLSKMISDTTKQLKALNLSNNNTSIPSPESNAPTEINL